MKQLTDEFTERVANTLQFASEQATGIKFKEPIKYRGGSKF